MIMLLLHALIFFFVELARVYTLGAACRVEFIASSRIVNEGSAARAEYDYIVGHDQNSAQHVDRYHRPWPAVNA